MRIIISFKNRGYVTLNEDGKSYFQSSFELEELLDIIFSDPLCNYEVFQEELNRYISNKILTVINNKK